jgi:hypothetical protein
MGFTIQSRTYRQPLRPSTKIGSEFPRALGLSCMQTIFGSGRFSSQLIPDLR